MDILTLSLATKKAEENLAESGKIAKTTEKKDTHRLTHNFAPNDDLGGMNAGVFEGTFGVKASDLRVRVWYKIEEYNATIPKDCTSLAIGDYSLGGLDPEINRGEHFAGVGFLVVFDFQQNMTLIITQYPGEREFEIVRYYNEIVPIDPKFLPGVCLPYINITTDITPILEEKTVYLNDEENEALRVAATNYCPVIINLKSFDTVIIVPSLLYADNTYTYNASMAGVTLSINSNDSEWFIVAVKQ